MHQSHFHIPHQEKRVIDVSYDDDMSSSAELSFSESNTGIRLLSIVFKSKRVNRNIVSYRTCLAPSPISQKASEPTSWVLDDKNHRLTSRSYHIYSSLRRLIIPRGIITIIDECLNNHGTLVSGSRNGTIIFHGSIHQLYLCQIPPFPYIPSKLTYPLCQSSLFSYDHIGNLQNEMQIFIMRQMVADSALYSYRLADRFLDNSASLMIVTVSDRSESRLVAEEFEVFSPSFIHFTTETMHNYYRDMWFDVDNMSYEELLALEDQIGYVSTGLYEEEALTSLKYSKYFLFAEGDAQKEFCSICQEEYVEEYELGTLDCGHNFHINCIKQWLGYKNICPICKSVALYTTDPL